MEMDPTGNLWFNLYNTWGGAGMGKFTGKDWFVFNMGTDLIYKELGLYVNAFAFDSGDSVWVGTDNGLAKFNGVSPEGVENL
jgi:ligand-binding sensor domain-containing protein